MSLKGHLLSYEVADTAKAKCPLEMSKVMTSENDTKLGDFLPYIRSDYNRQTGNAPNNPRKAVSGCKSCANFL